MAKPDLQDLTADVLEQSLDSLLEGSAKDIPVVGSILKLTRGIIGIRDFLFIRKITAFLRETSQADPNERRAFSEKMERDPKQQRRVGESLLLSLDSHDDIIKSKLLGRAFRAFMLGKIEQSTFMRMKTSIDRLGPGDMARYRIIFWERLEHRPEESDASLELQSCILLKPKPPGTADPGAYHWTAMAMSFFLYVVEESDAGSKVQIEKYLKNQRVFDRKGIAKYEYKILSTAQSSELILSLPASQIESLKFVHFGAFQCENRWLLRRVDEDAFQLFTPEANV